MGISLRDKHSQTSDLEMPEAERVCADGEPVVPFLLKNPNRTEAEVMKEQIASKSIAPAQNNNRADNRVQIVTGQDRATRMNEIMQGAMSGFQLRAVGSAQRSN